ncbi:MAG: hypothetical protein WAL89_10400 [Candidatus Sulfotelmatobacter sp.]|jgi:hypothetical protein
MTSKNGEPLKPFSLKREIDLGDLLTPFSILVALLALLNTWNDDRNLRSKQYADSIRGSASTVTAKLDRWGTLADRYFEDIQHALIVASEKTATTHRTEPAKRDLFDALKEAEGKASQRIVEEQLEISYMELYRYVPSLRPPFDKIKDEIGSKERASHRRLEVKLQEDMFDESLLKATGSFVMGKKLREDAQTERELLHQQIEQITQPLQENMLKLINLTDDELLDSRKRASVIAVFENSKQ